MKKLTALVLVFALLLSFSGCASPGWNVQDSSPSNSGGTDVSAPNVEAAPPSDGDRKTTTLTVCIDEYDRGLAFKSIFDKFEAEHPEIEVIYEIIPDLITENYTPEMRESTINRLRTQLMAGKGPDIYIDLMHPYGNRDEIEFLSDIKLAMDSNAFCDMLPYLESVGVNMDDFIAPVMEAGRVDGKQYIVPLHYDAYCIITNDYTWELLGGDNGFKDSFVASNSLSELSNITPGSFINTIQGYGLWYFQAEQACYALNPFYFTVPNAIDYSTYTVNIDTPQVREFMEKGKSIYDNITASALDFEAQEKSAPTEKTAAEFENSIKNEPLCLVGRYLDYMLSTVGYMDSTGAGVHAVPTRNMNGNVQVLVTMYAAVGANSEHKEEAAELIKLFLSEDIQKNTACSSGESLWPVRKGLIEDILCKYENEGIPAYSGYHPNNTYFFDSSPSEEMISQFENIENSITRACFPLPVEAGDILSDYYAGERDLDSTIAEMQQYMEQTLWSAN